MKAQNTGPEEIERCFNGCVLRQFLIEFTTEMIGNGHLHIDHDPHYRIVTNTKGEES